MNSLELFSGAGGLAKGLELAGFKHTALVENNKHAYASLCENFDPAKVFLRDVRDFDLEALTNIDIFAGGPPCQPFSLAGKHQAERDKRDLFPAAIRASERLKPKAFIFENVKGLLRQSFADYFEYILLRLTYPSFNAEVNPDWQENLRELRTVSKFSYSGIKYNVQFKSIDAANYGVPQKRERVIIFGIRSDLECDWLFPPETHSADRLFWDMYVTGEYWERHKISKSELPLLDKSAESRKFKLIDKYGMFEPATMPWQTVRDAIGNLPDPRIDRGIKDHLFHDGARIYPGHTGSILDAPAKTIKAGDRGVPGGENMIRFSDGSVRYLTVLEAKRLQTFSDDFVVKGVWGEAMRQIGNAVPVRLAEIMGQELIKMLNSDKHLVRIERLSNTENRRLMLVDI
ncbi:DNA (cytosine-5-)-methyltransferase [Chamaesiphon sp. OTE_8_metabat_110]|uniref:DNA cytosine methyltransferase n=1 Tax=Chamaesiphon sp. OTE_8_metabat_110 TaxID=2964696 RepID=UPI00286D1751|nr:DNA (cytosine-5-)-methyltransferase [Chamaesiphon sp. OTE_8_metabat_110]